VTVALHEASHWVVGDALGCRPTSATVDGDLGRCWFAVGRHRRTLEAIAEELVVDLAGLVGELIAAGDDLRDLPYDVLLGLERFEDQGNSRLDYEQAAARLLGSDELLEGRWWVDNALPQAATRAARILKSRWGEVTHIAGVLDATGRYEKGRHAQWA
jgi:hypothetical protein